MLASDALRAAGQVLSAALPLTGHAHVACSSSWRGSPELGEGNERRIRGFFLMLSTIGHLTGGEPGTLQDARQSRSGPVADPLPTRHYGVVTRPVPTRVFHMTRIERLPSVVEHGLLPDNVCRRRQIGGVEIGYDHIKRRRALRGVSCGVGGTLADYVPFYFAPRSPMLYAITRGQVSADAARTEQIAYLVSSTQALRQAGLTVIASNRHAELDYAELTEHDADLDGDEFIDWPLMTATYWNNTPHHPDRKERRQAECLVNPGVPWQAIAEVATKTERARAQVEVLLSSVGQRTPVVVSAEWYF